MLQYPFRLSLTLIMFSDILTLVLFLMFPINLLYCVYAGSVPPVPSGGIP